MQLARTRKTLLTRLGLVFFDDASVGPELLPEVMQQALELELAALGYVPSTRLAARMRRLSVEALMALRDWLCKGLAEAAGADVVHTPLFQSFPDDIPADTEALWLRKVLAHFMQRDDQPCLFCGVVGTTHVLVPCRHVVCDRCFDGRSYSACPICEHAVDRNSPFFEPPVERVAGLEVVRLRRLDLGIDLDAAARDLLLDFCARTQGMTPDDAAALTALVGDVHERLLPWLPPEIPLRENIARIFGELLQCGGLARIMPHARRYLTTATDVLRLVAAYSDEDPALQAKEHIIAIDPPRSAESLLRRFPGKLGATLAMRHESPLPIMVPIQTRLFVVRAMPRPLRRALLELLETLPPDALVEDMLRYRSAWVWLGRFLHPHEHARRLPSVARAFQIVRGRDPRGQPAPPFKTFAARVEAMLAKGDVDGALTLLEDRPGELARRLDHLLRMAADAATRARVVAAFARHAATLATPLLTTLRAGLTTRRAPAPVRVYWPKGKTTTGFTAVDQRAPLSADVITEATRVIDDVLLARFATLPAYDTAIIDDRLRQIVSPFNERTASRAKFALPRGSRVPLETPLDKARTLRLFLHWCEPEVRGETTDIDLSVAFFDGAWQLVGECSWSQLNLLRDDVVIAVSAGDRRDAPYPDGATEFVDIDLAAANRAGIRYAVMLVNNFRGMAFSELERGFAGHMLRDDVAGLHFDPRTVQHRFDLAGDNGVYVPLVVDLAHDELHWLDVYTRGLPAMNTVTSAEASVSSICQNLIAYFGSGARVSMFVLAALHASARTRRTIVRSDGGGRVFVRRDDESPNSFAARLIAGSDDDGGAAVDIDRPVFAALFRGDLELASGSTCYALFPERIAATSPASALLTP